MSLVWTESHGRKQMSQALQVKQLQRMPDSLLRLHTLLQGKATTKICLVEY